ncbi:hypothetical protein SAMN05421852_101226 [Thermoflavimicrobium dichotomicum]|uniref:Uncharacterized protein n=2 Tax=Thermoflavimicrobium dichotomicum TaxID=46223 RepID=A0A1I3JVU9_9BACL|nr:hypothetical protein SAMN05421852_101226 [Thermoflavimicrobium dichotomicum]
MPPEQKPKKKRKVGKIVGLFLASVIGFAACQAMFDDDVDDEDLCYDDNNDGYCDDNLQRHEPEVYKVSNGKKLYLRITDDDDSFGG